MPQSFSIPQELAAELGLPEAQGAPRAREFSVSRLQEWQAEVERRAAERKRERERGKAKSTFLPPEQVGFRKVGLLRSDY